MYVVSDLLGGLAQTVPVYYQDDKTFAFQHKSNIKCIPLELDLIWILGHRIWKISQANSNAIQKQTEFAFLRFWYLADAFILAYNSQRQTDSQTEQCGSARERKLSQEDKVFHTFVF